jgi:hypothetical protein
MNTLNFLDATAGAFVEPTRAFQGSQELVRAGRRTTVLLSLHADHGFEIPDNRADHHEWNNCAMKQDSIRITVDIPVPLYQQFKEQAAVGKTRTLCPKPGACGTAFRLMTASSSCPSRMTLRRVPLPFAVIQSFPKSFVLNA